MSISVRKTNVAWLAVASIVSLQSAASAAPVAGAVAIEKSAPALLEMVRGPGGPRGGHPGGHPGGYGGWHSGAWAGFAAGAIIGGLLAAPYYYPEDYPYYPPGYYGPGPDVAYCAQRFRSYDPVSGTYLGRDGFRHPCP